MNNQHPIDQPTAGDPDDLVVCRRCRRPLDLLFRQIGDHVEVVAWLHLLETTEFHEPEPVNTKETDCDVVRICDFCASSGPRWSYPCRDFAFDQRVVIDGFVAEQHISRGGWSACAQCHYLIRKQRYEKLASHIVRSMPAAERGYRKITVRAIITSFLENREGAPVALW